MKIIGTDVTHRGRSEPTKFVVELSQEEMRRIVRGCPYESVGAEEVCIEINKKFDEAMLIRDRCYAAVKLPDTHVAIAAILRLVLPQETGSDDPVAYVKSMILKNTLGDVA